MQMIITKDDHLFQRVTTITKLDKEYDTLVECNVNNFITFVKTIFHTFYIFG